MEADAEKVKLNQFGRAELRFSRTNNLGCHLCTALDLSRTPPRSRNRLALEIGRDPSQAHPPERNLEYAPNNTHDMVLGRLLLLRILHLLDASAPGRRRDAVAADGELALPHAAVDVDVLEADEHGAVGGALEPAVALPAEEEEDEQRPGEVELEESLGVEVGAADRVQGDVELGDEGDGVDEDADVGAVDAEGGLVGQLVQAVAVCFPVRESVIDRLGMCELGYSPC